VSDFQHILVTGGCGYKGTVLIPKLIARGYKITVVDTLWFGNYLEPHKNLNVLQVDIRNTNDIPIRNVGTIIHLASIANDPCGDLNPKLTWEVGALATMQLADKAVRTGVKQFIYASSGSVYGVKKEDQVTEDLELKPISEYNKTKMVAERALLSYRDKMVVQIVRPATVCGYSSRMRLDVSVNMLTLQALANGVITVFGGNQTRPNIHIDDITNVYLHLIDQGDSMQGIYNAGFENMSILDIANMVAKHVPTEIKVTESNDPRSYRVNSDKLLATGFVPKKTVESAIMEICKIYNQGALKNEDRFHNLKWMQATLFK